MKLLRVFYGFIVLTFLRKYLLYKKQVYLGKRVKFNTKTIFEGYNKIGEGSEIVNSHIGFGTYLGTSTLLPTCWIGSYCSIAKNVQVVQQTHPTQKFVSTHPAFFSILKQSGFTYVGSQLFEEILFTDKEKKFYAKIGHDVWIGSNVTIIGGVEIGNGAIIASGAIVTHNVNSYSIVAGVPAKVIRPRFSEDEINFLNNFKWWERSPIWLKENSSLFTDIKLFLEKYKITTGSHVVVDQ